MSQQYDNRYLLFYEGKQSININPQIVSNNISIYFQTTQKFDGICCYMNLYNKATDSDVIHCVHSESMECYDQAYNSTNAFILNGDLIVIKLNNKDYFVSVGVASNNKQTFRIYQLCDDYTIRYDDNIVKDNDVSLCEAYVMHADFDHGIKFEIGKTTESQPTDPESINQLSYSFYNKIESYFYDQNFYPYHAKQELYKAVGKNKWKYNFKITFHGKYNDDDNDRYLFMVDDTEEVEVYGAKMTLPLISFQDFCTASHSI